jgi:D-serine deaminase-like pyridoxal phosphate-dependent protein
MNAKLYHLNDAREVVSPAVLVFRELLVRNVREMIRVAGDVSRLRPHCKTHKMSEVVQMELAEGISKHKAATFAEAEMLADAGVKDVFLAYNLVGPNIRRAVRFREKFPDVTLAVTADHPQPLRTLSEAMSAAGQTIDVVLDVDSGLHRTGLAPGPEARKLYWQIAELPGVRPAGLHVYDGHHHQTDYAERKAAVLADYAAASAFRDELLKDGLPVPKVVAGGTGSFPVYAELTDPTVELSPGTCVLHDVSYGTVFPDLHFTPAAVLLTRVISRPTPHRLTLDLGNKSVAADPPMGTRVFFPDLPDAKQVIHNEEHLVLETPHADRYQPGDELIAIPRHVCPTSALHKQVFVVEHGDVVARWDVTARDRWLTV